MLSFLNDTLFLEDGGKVYLGGYIDNTDNQLLNFNNDTLYLSDGGEVYLGDYTDNTDDQQITRFEFNSATNEIYLSLEDGGQDTIDISSLNNAGSDDQVITQFEFNPGNNEVYIALEDGGQDTIDLSSLNNTGTDDQMLSFFNDTLFLEDGDKVYLGEYLDNTDNQLLSFNNDTLYLANGGEVYLGDYTDNTDDQQITRFEFNSATHEIYLSLEDGGQDTIDVSALNNTGSDDQSLTFVNDTLYLEDGCLLYTSPSPRD